MPDVIQNIMNFIIRISSFFPVLHQLFLIKMKHLTKNKGKTLCCGIHFACKDIPDSLLLITLSTPIFFFIFLRSVYLNKIQGW